MNGLKLMLIGLAALVVSSCSAFGGGGACDDTEYYEGSRLGEKIKVPSDLDEPVPSRDMSIPESSPREEQVLVAGICKEDPPVIVAE